MDAKAGPAYDQPTVIIVDDDAELLRALRFSLELDGMAVATHLSGESLVPANLPRDNGCLVLDYRLPSVDGLEVLEGLRRSDVTLPAILITSHASPAVRDRARAAGAVLVEKPLLGDALVSAIRDALAARSAGHA